MSKAFDNGMICAPEQAVLVDRDIYQEFEILMRKARMLFCKSRRKAKITRKHV